MNDYNIPTLPLKIDVETKAILKQLNRANKKLAELKGVALTIPNEYILISTLTLQEALDSSAVENIVTTQDELYRADIDIKENIINASTKEVLNYRQALQTGFELVRQNRLITQKTICKIQETLENNSAGYRKLPGTSLKNNLNEVVYSPPQDYESIVKLMNNLEEFINNNDLCDIDPLIKMAIIHHQFESIHPFYDGNGRTGRILSILYLVLADLLDLPILYLSRYITHHKAEYYRFIQAIRNKNNNNEAEWEAWILFMLKGVEETATQTIRLVKGISEAMSHFKQVLRPLFGKQYKHELLNHLFFHPYTKIEYLEKAMSVSRNTAIKYLNLLVEEGLLDKVKFGKNNYYINSVLTNLLMSVSGTITT